MMREEIEQQQVSKFVAKFPADQKPLESTVLDEDSPRRIFWTRQQTPPPDHKITSTTCSGDDAAMRTSMLHHKIQIAFTRFYSPPLNGLLQFWAPVFDETGPHLPLSTSQQPFSLEDLDNPRLVEYRLSSINSTFQHGLHAALFCEPFSLAVRNLSRSVPKGYPLLDKAIDCGLNTLILLPVVDPYIAPAGSCVGVVECCINTSNFHAVVQLILDLVLALKTAFVTTYDVELSLPPEPSHGINLAKVEIKEALKIVCESLHLSLAQVWIDIDTVNHVSCCSPSSPNFHNMEDDHPKQPAGKYVVKFCGYVTRCKQLPPDNDQYHAKLLDYYNMCDVSPFRMGKGLPAKTLQTHEPRFCKDPSNLTVENGMNEILCRMTRCSCLAICLRSTHTGKCVDYVFEFLWPQNRKNQIILLESLLLTLKVCLPSFKFPSGAQLGDELRVLDVGNSTPGSSETLSFKILQGNWFSQTPKTSNEEELHKQKLAKRKFSDLYEECEDHTDSDPDSADYVDRRLAAEYRKLVTVEKGFKFDSGMYQTWVSNMIKRRRSFSKASSLTELAFKVPSSDPQNTIVDNVTGKSEIASYKQTATNDQGTKNGEQLLRFVKKFPTQQLDSMVCGAVPCRRIFWSKTRPEKESSSRICSSLCSDPVDDDDVWRRWMIHEKIKSAFCRVYTPRIHGLIQFWAPVVDDETRSSSSSSSRLLSSSHQPFALEDLDDPCICEYRLFSINYQIIDDGGPHATAFLTHFPEVVQDIRTLDKEGRRSPLVDKALYCDLTCLILLPVFNYHPHHHRSTSSYDHDQRISRSSCVGVVECCIKPGGHLRVLSMLILALKSVGLTTYHVQQRLQYEPSSGLNHAKYEIEAALKIVCETLHLNLAQVWIGDDSVNHVRCYPSSPSSPFYKETKQDDTHQMKEPGMFVVKLCGYLTHSKDRDYGCYVNDRDYYDTCDVLPLKFGEGFVGKTLQTYETRFCKDLLSLERQYWLSGIPCPMSTCSGLVLCLRSTHTGQGVDYAFEFLWSQNRNQSILLESILLTLKMCLPSFKFASGAQLGDELQVLNVGCEISSFKVLPGNRFSQTSEEPGLIRVFCSSLLPKKLNDLYESDSQTDSESDVDSDADPDTDSLGCSDSSQTLKDLSQDKLC